MALAAEPTEFSYIIHPTDFSEASAPAFHHALRLAVAMRAHFYLVHVAPANAEEIGNWSAFPGVRSTLGRWGLLPQDAPPAAVHQQLGVRVTKAELQYREPVDGVLHFLNDNPCDFLVLAPDLHHDHAGRHKHSVSFPLARQANMPCLFVPVGVLGFVDGATGAADLRNILLVSGPAVAGVPAVGITRRIVDRFRCGSAMLHVLQSDSAADDASSGGGWPEDRTVRVQAPEADSETIGAQAAAIDADLIVLATRGDGVEQVVQAAGRPLLAVPSD
jgi:nucleotide-binding universal stress UspA family protein